VPAKHVPGSLQQRGRLLASKVDVPLDSATVHYFLAHCGNEDARKKVWQGKTDSAGFDSIDNALAIASF